jgi:tetratricopeptide (TPR) repeat protein
MNLAEAFYLAMPFLSWENIVLGDPLCAPYRTAVLTASQLHKGIDPETEQPAVFVGRRLAYLSTGGLNAEALKLTIRASVLTSRGNSEESEALLRKAIELEPRLTGVALDLASRESVRGNHDGAIEIYRKVLAIVPKDPIALNNLAYALAVYKNSAREALPYARSAFQISQIPIIADTLAWVHHLLGDDYSAKPLIERAAAEAPANVEILVHAAFIQAGVNDAARASEALAAAVKLDPKLSEREDIKALKKKIGGEPIE